MANLLDYFEVDSQIVTKIETYCQNLEVIIPSADTNRLVISSLMRLSMMGFKLVKLVESIKDAEQAKFTFEFAQGIVMTTISTILPAVERRSYNSEQRKQLGNVFKLMKDLYNLEVDVQGI